MPSETIYPGVYCVGHIIFLAIYLMLFAAGIILTRKYVKTEKSRNLILKISGAVLLVWIVINRVSVTYCQIQSDPESYSWLNLLPYTFCGLTSFLMALTAIFGKDDNAFLHFLTWMGLSGGIATVIYPDFLEKQTFWDIRSFSGLIHHAILLWICVFVLMTGQIRIDGKKLFYYPIGYLLMIALGYFEIYILKFPSAMNIDGPILSSLPVLTSWYVIFGVSTVAVGAIYLIFGKKNENNEKIKN